MLWTYLVSQANNPVALGLIISVGVMYALAKLIGLALRRPAEAYTETAAAPDPMRKAMLTKVYLGFLFVLLGAALLAVAGYTGPALPLCGIGFLVIVVVSEWLTPKLPKSQPIPEHLRLEEVVTWGQRRPTVHAIPASLNGHEVHSNGVTH